MPRQCKLAWPLEEAASGDLARIPGRVMYDPDGVSTFHAYETRSGWVPSPARGQRCIKQRSAAVVSCGVTDLLTQLASARTKFARGRYDANDYFECLRRVLRSADATELAAILPSWLEEQRSLSGSKPPMTGDDVVELAYFGFWRILDDARRVDERVRPEAVWAFIDKHLPGLHDDAIANIRCFVEDLPPATIAARPLDWLPTAIYYLPPSEAFREVIDRLAEKVEDVADQLDVLTMRRRAAGTVRDEAIGNSAVLDVIAAAYRAGRAEVVANAIKIVDHPLDVKAERRLDEIVESVDHRQSRTFDSLVTLLVLSGHAATDGLSCRLVSSLVDAEWPTVSPDSGRERHWSLLMMLGRAAAAAFFAGASEVARSLALLQLDLSESTHTGWGDTGEFLLARFVLAQSESDGAARRAHLAAAAKGARHGNVYPLFCRIYLDAARTAYEAGDLRSADVHAGYVPYLYRTRSNVEGHYWDPGPIVPFAKRIPFDIAELTELIQLISDAKQRTD
jgi:hypothetical protein